MKVWKNGGFGRRVGGILERPFLDQNVTKMTEVGVRRLFFENDRLWAPNVKTATPLSPPEISKVSDTKIDTKVCSYVHKLHISNNVGLQNCCTPSVHVYTCTAVHVYRILPEVFIIILRRYETTFVRKYLTSVHVYESTFVRKYESTFEYFRKTHDMRPKKYST